MKYLSRPYRKFIPSAGVILGAVLVMAPSGIQAQLSRITHVLEDHNPLLHTASQGYLGVLVGDVDSESAPKLKLKDVRGVVVTLIDHDAPAAQAGIRVNDVVLDVNGQAVEGAEQFGRMMREIPAGRKISLLVSRDGAQQTVTVQLVDRKAMEQEVWHKIDEGGGGFGPSSPGMGMLSSGSGANVPSSGSGFHLPFFGSTLNVGVMVEPLTSQMAEYLGVPNGLMVKQVARKSEASISGLKTFDVILKVGTENIATTADWDRALRANQGKPVQIMILRDRKQQTITLQVDSKRHHGAVEWIQVVPDQKAPRVTQLDGDPLALSGEDVLALTAAINAQTQLLGVQMQENFDPALIEAMQRQMDQLWERMEEMQALTTGAFV